MHDLDRTTLDEYGYEDEFEEEENEMYDDYEYMDDEDNEIALASELLEIEDDMELNEFLAGFVKKAVDGAKNLIKKRVKQRSRSRGRSRGRRGKSRRRWGRNFMKAVKMHRKVSRKALPIVGGILGSIWGGPIGGKIGAQAGSDIVKSGLYLEGMSPEDQQFELARRYVRVFDELAKSIVTSDSQTPDNVVIRKAMQKSSRHLPGVWKRNP